MAYPLDKTVERVVTVRVVPPWPRTPIGPDTDDSSSIVPAGNKEAAGGEPGEPCNESDTAGRTSAAQADIVEA